jgi:hypothetical protein
MSAPQFHKLLRGCTFRPTSQTKMQNMSAHPSHTASSDLPTAPNEQSGRNALFRHLLTSDSKPLVVVLSQIRQPRPSLLASDSSIMICDQNSSVNNPREIPLALILHHPKGYCSLCIDFPATIPPLPSVFHRSLDHVPPPLFRWSAPHDPL